MPPSKRRSKSKKHGRHLVLVLLLIIAGVFFLYEEFGKEKKIEEVSRITKPEKKPSAVLPEAPPKSLPKVAIIIDDLGPSKTAVLTVLEIKAPLTLSVLPRETYSTWIAEEGHRLGRDVIAHIPMEAISPHNLGQGGLYTWMTDREIIEALEKDIRSVPHALGASSHMGSAFTQDERAMSVVISTLKKHDLFFLDSITSPKTVGYDLAKMRGIKALKRDLFLDDSSDPVEIEKRWRELIAIADKKGHAILLAHPRKNTLEFLKNTLENNDQVTVVSISELVKQ
jgi:polysaccharide deacetylase 2 family uncharacterized protein YibQ